MKRLGGLLILASALGCAPAAPPPPEQATRPPSGPKVSATVLTIRESSHPPTRAFLHKVVIAGAKVRLGDEKDQWRLFDLEARTVTWVDDVAKTYRTVTLGELLRARERQLRARIPTAGVRPLSVRADEEAREIGGVPARRMVFEMGGYRRELWLSQEPLAGPLFLRMFVASEPLSEPWAGVMRDAQRALMNAQGFPVVDRSRLTWEGGELLFERQLVRIQKRDVPAEWVTIPADYRDVTVAAKKK
ncbi:MAG TPA: hypothetical protein VGF40_18415 [Thermoanaerobaculia bacterium]